MIASSGLVLAAVYSLILVQRAFHGTPREDHHNLADLSRRELTLMMSLMLILLGLGLYPQVVLDTSAASMASVQALYEPAQHAVEAAR